MHGLILAHDGTPTPAEAWTAWDVDPFLAGGLLLLLWLHHRGRRRSDRWRNRAFRAAVATVALAVLTPLDAVSAALASAHMVQHVLLIAVAAPLFAVSAPGAALLRGAPLALRRVPGRLRRGTGLPAGTLRLPDDAAAVWLVHVAVLWTWHSAPLYEAALASPVLHPLEHALFLGTGVLLWRAIVGRGVASGDYGRSVLLVFATAMQGVLLSLLLTFATEPWYDAYVATAPAWGLTALEDQHLAGVLMWIPTGVIQAGIALALFAAWLRSAGAERPATAVGEHAHGADRVSGPATAGGR